MEGNELCHDDGLVLGLTLGTTNGWEDGDVLDSNDEKFDGNRLGWAEGVKFGDYDELVLGLTLGNTDGRADGNIPGNNDGRLDGTELGFNAGL